MVFVGCSVGEGRGGQDAARVDRSNFAREGRDGKSRRGYLIIDHGSSGCKDGDRRDGVMIVRRRRIGRWVGVIGSHFGEFNSQVKIFVVFAL